MNIDEYIKIVAESIDNEDKTKNEPLNETKVNEKYYDWSEDFKFTPDVVSDLRKRDMFGICATGIRVMIPVNRDNAPNYYRPDQFDYRKDKDGNWKDGEEPDFESYNILHIQIIVDATSKTFDVSRWFGHRLDWDGENHTSTEIDWSDIPVLSKDTVKSLIDVYKDHDVFENLKVNLVEYAKKHEEYLDKYVGRSEKLKKDWEDHNKWVEQWGIGVKYDIQKKLEELLEKRANKTSIWSKMIEVCNAIIDGSYKTFQIEMDFPEVPSKEMIEKRYKEHSDFEKATNKALSDYYSTHSYTGD